MATSEMWANPNTFTGAYAHQCGTNLPVVGMNEAIVTSEEEKRMMEERCLSHCEAYGRICPYAAKRAGKAAREAVERLSGGSDVFNSTEGGSVTSEISRDDIVVGSLLGKGGFSEVHECRLGKENDAGSSQSLSGAPSPYAIKFLKRRVMADRRLFRRGAADLAIEAKFLSAVDHPHIIKLHYVTSGNPEANIASGKECSFFLVIDRLVDTLEARIPRWQEDCKKNKTVGNLAFFRSAFQKARLAALLERLQVAYQVAQAVQYLHSRGIVYRDLKPDNIGFDKDGNVKLFDFGLAKELKDNLKCTDGRYDLTGHTGSRRYMAPEVARDLHYGKGVDAYSFGILLWELGALEKPFAGYCEGRHMDDVVLGGQRPRIDSAGAHSHWPLRLQNLMERCWDPDQDARPSFDQIAETLGTILRDEDQGREQAPAAASPRDRSASVAVEDPAPRRASTTLSPPSPSLFSPGAIKLIKLPKKARGTSAGGFVRGL